MNKGCDNCRYDEKYRTPGELVPCQSCFSSGDMSPWVPVGYLDTWDEEEVSIEMWKPRYVCNNCDWVGSWGEYHLSSGIPQKADGAPCPICRSGKLSLCPYGCLMPEYEGQL